MSHVNTLPYFVLDCSVTDVWKNTKALFPSFPSRATILDVETDEDGN